MNKRQINHRNLHQCPSRHMEEVSLERPAKFMQSFGFCLGGLFSSVAIHACAASTPLHKASTDQEMFVSLHLSPFLV